MTDVAARLAGLLAEPPADGDIGDVWSDVRRVSDEELGTLLPAAYRVGVGSPFRMMQVRLAVEGAARERQVRFTPEACTAVFDALVAGLETRKWADLALGAAAVARCTGTPPDVAAAARTLVRFMLDEDRVDPPYALLAVAGLTVTGPTVTGPTVTGPTVTGLTVTGLTVTGPTVTGPTVAGPAGAAAADDGTLRAVIARLARGAGPIALDEMDVIAGLAPAEGALLAEARSAGYYGASPPRPDLWPRIAAIPAYAAYARRALEAAAERARAVQAGEIPYRADKAFEAAEVIALGNAARLALHGDEPWLPALLDGLLRDVSVAPTAARTLPSQSLLYEIVRAGEAFPTPELVASLHAVRSAVRHAGVPKQLGKMLRKVEAALAERTGVALRMPGLGFGPGGELRRAAGEHEAVVTVADDVRLTWWKDGAPLRSVPAAVRRDHADLVKELRDLVKRVRVQLATLARALEGGFAAGAVHEYAEWRTRLGGHPLAGTVARRLIWEIETAPGEWRAVLPEVEGLPDAGDGAAVRLWHPGRAAPETVAAYRDLLTERRVRQPFKQAFREVYLLTPAEEASDHSDRFAAHLVHYRTMFALFRARDWKSDLLGPWDGGGEDEAVRTLAAGEWRVRLHHVFAGAAGDRELASTGRVRFARRADGGRRDAPLADVPPIVFSEAMRDVDLFVGAASIAADPTWTGDGAEGDYWERAAFGELTETAETRGDALARVLPGTRIAARCALDGRFLVVRGDLRTYRIHLGSGNVLMEPDGAHLCIVPAAGRAGGAAFLPFDDDRLALILAKAFLLAADTKITDASIRAQIDRAG